jgi:murein DD-endopeptidase MepM/ murein hydrolase activator NlpD
MLIRFRSPWRVACLILCLIAPGPLSPVGGAPQRRPARTARKGKPRPARRVVKRAKLSPPNKAVIKAQLVASKQKSLQAKAQLSGVKQEMRNAEKEIRVKEAQIERLSDQIRELQYREMEAGKRLKGAVKRLAIAERRVVEVKYRLAKAEKRLQRHHGRLSTRIQRSYTSGSITFVDVLLQASSLTDFLDRQYYVQRIFSSDMEFLTDLREEQAAVERLKKEFEEQRDEQQIAKEEMSLQLQEVQGLKASRYQFLQKIRTDKELKEQELKELEQDSTSIASLLEGEWRRRRQLWQQLYRGRVPMARWVGQWLRPVPYPISSGYGLRFHPILGYARLHSGIDFAAPPGAPIRAAADGEVIWASWRGGYGRCIILLHGDGVATLYAHCSDTVVRPGQQVKRGQWIGNVGTTGLSTGPHLHFEIRVNGHPVNPIGR